MIIAVLIKQVPVSNDVSVDPQTHALVRASSEAMINPADLNAIETAMILREQTEGKVVVFTMGPLDAEKALRDALAMGCDEACLITDRCFAGGDTIATAKVLAKSITKYGTFDLILSGALSSDGATGQVGAMVAEYMDIPHVAEIQGVAYTDGENSINVVKKFQGMETHIKAQLPALMSVCFGCNEPRLTTLRSKRAAKTKSMETYTNTELKMDNIDIGLAGSPTIVTDSFAPEHTKKAQMLSGTEKEMAEQLKALIEIEKGKE